MAPAVNRETPPPYHHCNYSNVVPFEPIRRAGTQVQRLNFGSRLRGATRDLQPGLRPRDLTPLHYLGELLGPFEPHAPIFRTGERFAGLFTVRTGAVKTERNGADGRRTVTGFHLPGEVFGISGVYNNHYACDALAIETTSVCRVPFASLATIAASDAEIQRQLFRILGRPLHQVRVRRTHGPASARVALFLLDLARRHARNASLHSNIQLTMSRADIASYLCLTRATVNRIMLLFRRRGWVQTVMGQRIVVLTGRQQLEAAANQHALLLPL